MKQKLFLLLIAACSGQIAAKSSIDSFIDFNKMEEGQKKDWLDYCDRHHSQKTKLMKNQMHDCIELKNKHLKHAKGNTNCSPEAKDAKIAKHLDESLQLYENHVEGWRNWCNNSHKEALEIADRHDAQLEKFKNEFARNYGEMEPSRTNELTQADRETIKKHTHK